MNYITVVSMQYYYVSSPYGIRVHPKSKRKQMHHGIDMAGTWQEEVRAPSDGYVSFSGRNGSFGKTIKIVHKHGVSTLYGHLHRLNVKKGMNVTEGEVIGKMGSTGRAVGAHLHYEIIISGRQVNPLRIKLPSGKQIPKNELENFYKKQEVINSKIYAMRNKIKNNEFAYLKNLNNN